jgi:cytochrome d ubiquinol oxidase subunit I
LGFIAVEAGWTVTEVGRQPWIIYEIMKTEDALSPMPGLKYSLYLIIGLYLLLSIIVSWLMYRQVITLSDRYESAKSITN